MTAGASVRDVNFAATHNFWAYGADNASSSAITVDANGINAAFTAADQYLALKLTVPGKGDYALNVSNAANTNGGKADVYVIPANTDNISTALTNKIGEVDFSAAGNTAVGTVNVAAAGEYLIVFKTQAGTKFGVNPGVISLTAGDAVSAMDMVIAAGKTELKLGEGTKLTPTAYISDPEVNDITFRYEALDAYTTVDADGNVTVVKADTTVATAQIKVTAVVYGQEVGSAVITLTIKEFIPSGVKVVYAYKNYLEYTFPVRDVTADMTHNFWSYYADYAVSSGGTPIAMDIHTSYGIRAGIWNTNRWFAVKLNVPVAGDYQMTQAYRTSTNGAITDFFILPGNTAEDQIAGLLTAENKVGRIDMYASSEKDLSAEFGSVRFESAGEYLLVAKTVGQNPSSGSCYVQMGATTLNGGDGLAPMDMVATIEKNTLKETDKLQITAKTYMSNGTVPSVTYTYTSLTPATASVDATGVITGLAAGTAKIKVAVTMSGKTLEKEISLTILPLEASDTTLVFNYMKWQTYTDPVREITYEKTHNTWSYYADYAVNANNTAERPMTIHTHWGIQAALWNTNRWFALKLKVPVAGDYQMTQAYRANKYGCGEAKVYILPGDTAPDAIGTTISNTKEIGKIKFYSTTDEDKVADFGMVSFETAGEYLLVVKTTKENGVDGNCYINLGTTKFIGGEGLVLSDLTASVEKTQIKETDTLPISALAYLSDMSTSKSVITYTSLTPELASVNAEGVITGIAPGTAKIKVSATAGGATLEKIIEVEVLKLNPSGLKLDISLMKYLSYTKPVREVTYANTHGYWEYYASRAFNNDGKTERPIFIHTHWGITAETWYNNHWFAIKIKVPRAGDYKFTMDYHRVSNGSNSAIYILPGTTATTEIDGLVNGAGAVKEVGFVDYYSKVTDNTTKDFGTVTFDTAGEYIVVYKVVGKGGNGVGGTYMYPGTMHFYGGEETAIIAMEAKINKTNVKQGDTAQASATTYLSDGSIANIIYTYESLNEFAAVNRAGVVTGVKPGVAQIKVTGKTADETAEQIVSLNVGTIDPSGTRLYYDFLTGLSHGTDVRKITYEKTLGTWEYYDDGDTGRTRTVYINTNYGAWFQNSRNFHWIAYKIKVTDPGDYLMTIRHGMYYAGCYAGVYILPGDTPKDQIYSNLTTANKVNELHMGSKSLKVVNTRAGIVNFPEAGEYLLVYRPLRESDAPGVSGWNLFMGSVTLDGINCLKTVEALDTTVNLNWGETYKSRFTLRNLAGELMDPNNCTVNFRSADPLIASVDDNGVVKAEGHGTTTIYINAYDGVQWQETSFTVNCTDNTGVKNAFIDVPVELFVRETSLAYLSAQMNSGNVIRLPIADTTLTVSDEKLMSINKGTVTAHAEGTVTIKGEGYFMGEKLTAELAVKIIAHEGKTGPTYYTTEMQNNARNNILRYDWAQSTRDSAVKSARYYLRSVDHLYTTIMPDNLPRNRQIGYRGGEYRCCRYCGADVMGLYGSSGVGGWAVDPIDHPWKVQCKDCLRWFPSNDFESFYKLGLDENGEFNYEKAWEENEKLKATGHKGYLVNELYPEKGEGWGVDDGYGARVYKDGSELKPFKLDDTQNDKNLDLNKSATYIPVYMYYYWHFMRGVITSFTNAYVYTGDITYARAGAILLDRIADVAPGYGLLQHANAPGDQDWVTTCGGTSYGVFVGRIDDPLFFRAFCIAADVFFEELDDPYILKYLSRKATALNLENDKSSSQKIWENWRDNIVYLTLERNRDGNVQGNYGLGHYSVSTAGVVIAGEPETREMFDWILACDPNYGGSVRTAKGGDFLATMIRTIDRDGMGNEASAGYNCIWLKTLYVVAEDMAMYGDEEYNLYNNPKFAQMFLNYGELVMSDSHTVQIGDQGAVASLEFVTSDALYIAAWKQYRNTSFARKLAQDIYISNKGNLSGISYGIFHEDPLAIQREITNAITEKHWEKSGSLLSGYGFSALREGRTGDTDSLRGAWMYYSINYSHGHSDTLNLGIEAFGLNLAPDLGYPPNTIGDNTNSYWIRKTPAHNTVTVDDSDQERLSKVQDPYLFDDSKYVDVMGVQTTGTYRQCEIYKRTVVQVKVDGDNSYYVDFFRVLGGEKHVYSFHAQSQGAMPVEGLDLEMQIDENGAFVGTYAGADVPFDTRGSHYAPYAFMTKVRRDYDPDSNRFTVDFAITDYRGAISNSKNIHLKMTQINNFVPDDVAIVGGLVPGKKDNNAITEETDTLEYVLTARTGKEGEKLDSLFTTVFEPYRGTSYITSIVDVPVKVVSGKPGPNDEAMAVMVTHKSGRVDYVFYAANKEVTYRVADIFDVKGYVGVYSLDGKKGTEIFRYVVGGDIIVESAEQVGTYKGTVIGFSMESVLNENYIDVNIDPSAASLLAGKVVHVENDKVQNGVYKILSAKPIEGGVRLNLGNTSLIRGLRDKNDLTAGYVYNIAKGQRVEIPMPYTKCDLDTTAKLSHLEIIGGQLVPAFDAEIYDYTCFVGEDVRTLGFRAAASMPNAKVRIEKGAEAYDADYVEEMTIGKSNKIQVTVTAEDGMTTKTYFIKITRADHFCYGGTAYCDEKAVCIKCGGRYGEIDIHNHKVVELWNGKYATKDADGYSGDYYCVSCKSLASKGHILVYQPPVNAGLILWIAAGVVLVGGGATAATILVVKKRKAGAAPAEPNETQE